MSIESGAQFAELRDLANQGVGQLSRAAARWFDLVRDTLDAAESSVTACCDHARKIAQAGSPAECVQLQMEFVKSSIHSMQERSTQMMRMHGQSAAK